MRKEIMMEARKVVIERVLASTGPATDIALMHFLGCSKNAIRSWLMGLEKNGRCDIVAMGRVWVVFPSDRRRNLMFG